MWYWPVILNTRFLVNPHIDQDTEEHIIWCGAVGFQVFWRALRRLGPMVWWAWSFTFGSQNGRWFVCSTHWPTNSSGQKSWKISSAVSGSGVEDRSKWRPCRGWNSIACRAAVRALGLVGIGCSGDDGSGVVFRRFLGPVFGASTGRLMPCWLSAILSYTNAFVD